jgi:ribosomal protein S18 acetylase RimI-like enzyme
MVLNIRLATTADRSAILAILRDTTEFAPIDVKVAGELLDASLQDPRGSGYDTYVAELDNMVAGYVCFGRTPLTEGVFDLYWIAVSPSVRNHGIGRALLAFVEKDVSRLGGRMLLIETSSTPPYDAARTLYIRMGFQAVARVKDFYLPGDDKVIFQKFLSR